MLPARKLVQVLYASKYMAEKKQNKFLSHPYAGIKVTFLFVFWVLVAEYGPLLLSKGPGAFLWTTFHFIVNPILGVIIFLFLIWHALSQKQLQPKVLSIAVMFFPLLVCYVGFSGNIWFVELMGINFN